MKIFGIAAQARPGQDQCRLWTFGIRSDVETRFRQEERSALPTVYLFRGIDSANVAIVNVKECGNG